MRKRGNRGQITLFIIIGIIILVAAAVFLFMRQKDDGVGGSFHDALIRDVPQEMRPISSYIDKCLLDSSLEAIELVGKQGGYAYPRESGVRSRPGIPTSGNAIYFPVTGMDIPYWWYLESPDDCLTGCVFTTEMPYLRKADGSPSIEREIEKYVDRNVGLCLDDLGIFTKKGWEIEIEEEPSSEVSIAGEEVYVLLNYRFKARNVDVAWHDLESFIVAIPVPLQDIYTQAFVLAYLEKNASFLEHHTMNIINSFDYDGEESGMLPSTGHTDFSFGNQEYWSEYAVEGQVKTLLESYVPWLQVNGSANYIPRDAKNPGVEAMIDQGMLLPGDPSFSDLEVSFSYLPGFWDRIHFDLCDGGICAPRTTGITYPVPIGVSLYAFYYDISYPVMVEIFDQDSLGREGYSFHFAMESNVRDNFPMYGYAPLPLLDAPSSEVSQLFCHPMSRNSGNITITVLDSYGKPIKDASIIYTSAKNSCPMGLTDAQGRLKDRFPTSMGGILEVIAENHSTEAIRFSTFIGEDKEETITLHNIVPITLRTEGKLAYWDSGKDEWSPQFKSDYFMQDDDQILITFERESKGMLEEDFMVTVSLMGNETAVVGLVPGDYSLQAWSIYKKNVTIDDCIDTGDDDCEPIHIVFEGNLVSGALNINITILPVELSQEKDMVVYLSALNPHNLRTLQELDIISELESISTKYETQFSPTWE